MTSLSDLEARMARIESRLVQLMHFLGADPTKRYGPQAPLINLDVPTVKRNHPSNLFTSKLEP